VAKVRFTGLDDSERRVYVDIGMMAFGGKRAGGSDRSARQLGGHSGRVAQPVVGALVMGKSVAGGGLGYCVVVVSWAARQAGVERVLAGVGLGAARGRRRCGWSRAGKAGGVFGWGLIERGGARMVWQPGLLARRLIG